MSTEKLNGTKCDPYLAKLWAIEDRQIGEAMVKIRESEEGGSFPKTSPTIKGFGQVLIFGTGGETAQGEYEDLWKEPENYNLKK